MKNAALIELVICGTIGLYCVTRMYVLLPAAIRQARELVELARLRRSAYDELLDQKQTD